MATREDNAPDGLLQELLWAYGPCGQEADVRAVCARELQPVVDDMWTDDAGNLIGYIAANPAADDSGGRHRHRTSSEPGVATRIMAHMDELSMLVKRVEPDATLHLAQLGTMHHPGEPADLGDQARPG